MRRIVRLGLLLGLGLQVSAAGAASITDQYGAAADIFLGKQRDRNAYQAAYAADLIPAVEGKWAEFSISGVNVADPAMVNDLCSNFYIQIQRSSAYSFSMSEMRPKRQTLPLVYTTFTSVAGAVFNFSTSADAALKAFDLDKSNIGADTKYQILSRANGLAFVFHPSPDILVVQSLFATPPRILARCTG